MRIEVTKEFADACEQAFGDLSQLASQAHATETLVSIWVSAATLMRQQKQTIDAAFQTIENLNTKFTDALLREKGYDPAKFASGQIERTPTGPVYVAVEREPVQPGPVSVPVPVETTAATPEKEE